MYLGFGKQWCLPGKPLGISSPKYYPKSRHERDFLFCDRKYLICKFSIYKLFKSFLK